ncbi:19486_t:CDS:2, partial [Gigaspora rosea]
PPIYYSMSEILPRLLISGVVEVRLKLKSSSEFESMTVSSTTIVIKGIDVD